MDLEEMKNQMAELSAKIEQYESSRKGEIVDLLNDLTGLEWREKNAKYDSMYTCEVPSTRSDVFVSIRKQARETTPKIRIEAKARQDSGPPQRLMSYGFPADTMSKENIRAVVQGFSDKAQSIMPMLEAFEKQGELEL